MRDAALVRSEDVPPAKRRVRLLPIWLRKLAFSL
jgi:hypothetical protein